MSMQIPEKIQLEKEFIVEDKFIASFLGSGAVAVLSTPSMILLMENVSRLMIDEILPKGYTTVGTEVHVKHLAAAPKKAKIVIKSMFLGQNDKRLSFSVECWWNDTKIGEGTHERFIIDHKKFMARVEQKIKEGMK